MRAEELVGKVVAGLAKSDSPC
ncbi:hypothetical protein PPL_10026 [Heterostelium album PN500]|uniref:Uncharacterized protein n=1 Tax=Heterostelium pallidum (strain ATCC 26659 / Pp 5 / PN500) TaxID=670386 RepID=D3BPY2_HETP5|nr:hypothetical protein PPL_10026 [Heterostelium album PN500]